LSSRCREVLVSPVALLEYPGKESIMERCVTIFLMVLGLVMPETAFAAAATAKSVIAHAAVNARVLPLWAAKEQGSSPSGVPAEMIFIRQAPTLVRH
jgi:hypothetical protein